MSVLAAAPAAQPAPYEEQVAALVDVAALVARGLDLDRRRFVPGPSDPLFGYARCPVRGCLNVTEHTATSLCSRCQHRYGRWQHATGGSDFEHFLAEVTQTRSEDLERLCLVCRTPGHERPAAAQRLCYCCPCRPRRSGPFARRSPTDREICPSVTPVTHATRRHKGTQRETGPEKRALHADFLDEAAALLEAPALGEAATGFRTAAALWHELAERALPGDVPEFAQLRDVLDAEPPVEADFGRLSSSLEEIHGTEMEAVERLREAQ